MAESMNQDIQAGVRSVLETQDRILMGPRASHEIEKDPKHLLFVLSRYKFVAKLLENRGRLLEVGAGDGFGANIVAQGGNHIVGVDLEPIGLEQVADTRWTRERMRFVMHDMVSGPYRPNGEAFDGGYTLDVIEHIHPDQEHAFVENIVRSLKPDAPLIVGTPNEAAKAYASKEALEQHINWKTHETLHATCSKFYSNVFMFGMNDEVMHTGYSKMCHYIFALCVQPR